MTPGSGEQFGFAGDDVLLGKCLTLWAALIGAVGLEVFGQYGPDTFADPALAFDPDRCADRDAVSVGAMTGR